MTTQLNRLQVPDVRFRARVLIIGRAVGGKTSILQRVCDTTESPEIYRLGRGGTRHRVELDIGIEPHQHDIDDELIFSNHDGYIFHDSRGFEAGSRDELDTVREFVQRKLREKRLNDRLHAIWYCIPMDNDRPSLDLKHFDEFCLDKNVPVIAVFTKYDQFKRNIRMKLEDEGRDPKIDLDAEAEKIFKQDYLASLNGPPPFIRLEKMQKHGQRCAGLIEMTADLLSSDVVTLMLMAVQRDNLEYSIKQAIQLAYREFERGNGSTEAGIKICISTFSSLWDCEGRKREKEKIRQGIRKRIESELSRLIEREEELRRERREEEEFFRDFSGSQLSLSSIVSTESLERRSRAKLSFSKLRSFDPDLRIPSDGIHHAMIAVILILDRASLFYASPSRPTLDDALDQACSQYGSSGIHIVVKEQFLLHPTHYSISQFTEFILIHRLG